MSTSVIVKLPDTDLQSDGFLFPTTHTLSPVLNRECSLVANNPFGSGADGDMCFRIAAHLRSLGFDAMATGVVTDELIPEEDLEDADITKAFDAIYTKACTAAYDHDGDGLICDGTVDEEVAPERDETSGDGQKPRQNVTDAGDSIQVLERVSRHKRDGEDFSIHENILTAATRLSDYPDNREGHLEFLRAIGARHDINTMRHNPADWHDDLVRGIAEREDRSIEKEMETYGLAPMPVLVSKRRELQNDLKNEQELERLAGIYKTSLKSEQSRLKARLDIVEASLWTHGGEGTQKHDWKKVEYKDMSTFQEQEDFWLNHGVVARFDVPADAEAWAKDRFDVNDINAMSHEMVSLLKQYPETELSGFGLAYAMDKQHWDDARRANLHEEFEKKSSEAKAQGKRWSKAAARKRVEKRMVPPPPKDHDKADSSAKFRYRYGIFGPTAHYADHSRSIHFRHSAKHGLTNPDARAADLARVRDGKDDYMDFADMSLRGVVRHEFAHALDETIQAYRDPRMKSLYQKHQGSIREGLSDYAATNIREFIAEGFTEAMHRDSRPMAKEIMDLINDIADERAGAE